MIILTILLVFSIFLSVYGAVHSKEFTKGESIHSESNVQILTFNTYSNRHISESIGVVMFVVVFLLFRFHFITKRVFFRKSMEVANRFLETGNEYAIQFDKDNVEYKSYDLYMRINWIKFSNYKVSKNFVFIGEKTLARAILVVDKRLMTETELDTMYGLFKSNDVREIKSFF
ncbi:hypothetical protein [Flavobacterium daemonense]|uniref:hypothetical protein n=1 Tax=Flavobacterium daemonense TaxID=1393049 RepID=UPI001186F542|nr:hypothetical protein [Flavobacterium daemonense]KAF2335688.1 hypothetical protein FND99_05880 [Flavobacterium daemonense]